jgi:hypothetical protein
MRIAMAMLPERPDLGSTKLSGMASNTKMSAEIGIEMRP